MTELNIALKFINTLKIFDIQC